MLNPKETPETLKYAKRQSVAALGLECFVALRTLLDHAPALVTVRNGSASELSPSLFCRWMAPSLLLAHRAPGNPRNTQGLISNTVLRKCLFYTDFQDMAQHAGGLARSGTAGAGARGARRMGPAGRAAGARPCAAHPGRDVRCMAAGAPPCWRLCVVQLGVSGCTLKGFWQSQRIRGMCIVRVVTCPI